MAKRNPSAKVVQDLYVATRQEEMEITSKPQRDKAYEILCAELLRRLDPKKKQKIPYKELKRVYQTIERNLQTADLTINFTADSWFTNENTYDTYAQMYERAMEGGVMVLKDRSKNPADVRAKVDNEVSFPKSWFTSQAASDAKKAAPEFEDEIRRGNAGVRGGLSPDRQGTDRLMRQMNTGGLAQLTGNRADGFRALEKNFNPRTKQIFLALNYGRRRNGASTNYGKSYLVAKKELKPKCFFYCNDTFIRNGSPERADDLQYSYDNLGAILGDSRGMLLGMEIMASCYEGKVLPEESPFGFESTLLEAHLFSELRFRDDVEYMAISQKDVSDAKLWPQIVENATKFCNRVGIPLYLRT